MFGSISNVIHVSLVKHVRAPIESADQLLCVRGYLISVSVDTSCLYVMDAKLEFEFMQ